MIGETAGRPRVSGGGDRHAWSDMDRPGANAASVAAPDATCSALPSCRQARYAAGSGKSWSDRDRKDPWSPGPRHNLSRRRRSKPIHITRQSRGASVRASQPILARSNAKPPQPVPTGRMQTPAPEAGQPASPHLSARRVAPARPPRENLFGRPGVARSQARHNQTISQRPNPQRHPPERAHRSPSFSRAPNRFSFYLCHRGIRFGKFQANFSLRATQDCPAAGSGRRMHGPDGRGTPKHLPARAAQSRFAGQRRDAGFGVSVDGALPADPYAAKARTPARFNTYVADTMSPAGIAERIRPAEKRYRLRLARLLERIYGQSQCRGRTHRAHHQSSRQCGQDAKAANHQPAPQAFQITSTA